jgi:hypothetical protein
MRKLKDIQTPGELIFPSRLGTPLRDQVRAGFSRTTGNRIDVLENMENEAVA